MKYFPYGLFMGTSIYRWTARLRAVWHVLRGRPIAYRLRLAAPVRLLTGTENFLMQECFVDGSEQASVSITIGAPQPDLRNPNWRPEIVGL